MILSHGISFIIFIGRIIVISGLEPVGGNHLDSLSRYCDIKLQYPVAMCKFTSYSTYCHVRATLINIHHFFIIYNEPFCANWPSPGV